MHLFLADPKVTYQVYLTSAFIKIENKNKQTSIILVTLIAVPKNNHLGWKMPWWLSVLDCKNLIENCSYYTLIITAAEKPIEELIISSLEQDLTSLQQIQHSHTPNKEAKANFWTVTH